MKLVSLMSGGIDSPVASYMTIGFAVAVAVENPQQHRTSDSEGVVVSDKIARKA